MNKEVENEETVKCLCDSDIFCALSPEPFCHGLSSDF